MTTFRTLWLYLVLLSPICAGATDDIREVETRTVPVTRISGATHELQLALYVFRGGKWSADEIAPAVILSAAMLAQCGITLAHARLRVLEAPPRFHVYATAVSRELLRQLRVAKPALFFVDDTLNHPAFDAEAIGRANAVTRPELADTVWIAYGARDLPQALAHELVHVLADSGEHSDEADNLMYSETSPGNTRLTAAQCAGMRRQGEASGLLKPVRGVN